MVRYLIQFSFTILLGLILSACSLDNASKSASPTDASGLPSADRPLTPTEPVLISEPLPAISESPNPQTDADPQFDFEREDDRSDLQQDDPAALKPPTIAEIEETPTSPAAEVIDVSTVIDIKTPETDFLQDPSDPKTISEPVLELSAEPIPIPLLETIEISNPTEISPAETPVDTSIPEDQTLPIDADDNGSDEETDIVVVGSCLGKKKAGLVWYDNRGYQKKKNKSVTCKNNKFELIVKEKKKDLKYIELQTLFFD